MFYIIQENMFREEGLETLLNLLKRFRFKYELVKVLPDVETLNIKTKRKDVFVFGTLKMARLIKPYGFIPGTLITKNHDYTVYSRYYTENLLNYDSKVVRFGDGIEWKSDKYFIRPVLDSKVFTGKVFNKEEWEVHTKKILSRGNHSITDDTLFQLASPKKITQEVRLWVVDGKIVTQSTYRRGTFVHYSDVVDNDAIVFGNKMIKLFQLEKAFTMDVGLTENGWKIVECGSVARAGFYAANIQKLIIALEEAFNTK